MHSPAIPNRTNFDSIDEYCEAWHEYDAKKENYDEWVETEIERRRDEEIENVRKTKILGGRHG